MTISSEWLMSMAALAAVWAGGVTRFLSKNEWARNAIWCRVPEGYRFLVPFANAFVVGLGVSLAKGSPWKAALLETLSTTVAGGLGAVGGHEALKDSPLPYANKDTETCAVAPEVPTLRTGDAPRDVFPHEFASAVESLLHPSQPPKPRRLPLPPPKPGEPKDAA